MLGISLVNNGKWIVPVANCSVSNLFWNALRILQSFSKCWRIFAQVPWKEAKCEWHEKQTWNNFFVYISAICLFSSLYLYYFHKKPNVACESRFKFIIYYSPPRALCMHDRIIAGSTYMVETPNTYLENFCFPHLWMFHYMHESSKNRLNVWYAGEACSREYFMAC